MKIFRPGFPVKYEGEAVPASEQVPEKSPLPSVAEAMNLAQARHTQILDYGRKQSPLQSTPTFPGLNEPHAVNDKPEVEK